MSNMQDIVKRDAAVHGSYRSSADIVRDYLGSEANPEGKRLPLFFTPIEAAELLRLSRRTLEKMRLQNRGPRYYRVGDGAKCRVLYSLADIADWLAQHARGRGINTRQQ